jgi:hypothetical protein
MDINKIGPNYNRELLVQSNTSNLTYYTTGMYGAGITITSKKFNIFSTTESAKFLNLPYECTNFDYTYTDTETYQVYTLFCPVDGDHNLTRSTADIIITSPLFNQYFTSGFQLNPVISYAASESAGGLIAFKKESQTIISDI